MRTIEIAVCDDETIYIERLVKFIEVYSDEAAVELNLTSYISGEKLVEDIREDEKRYDIVFLDVEMPQMDGMDVARAIRNVTMEPILCFVTSHETFAREAYRVEALGYLVKPVSYVELKRLLGRAVVMIQYQRDCDEAEERYVEIPVARNTAIVDVRNIQYIEKRRNQCILHCTDREITCYEVLKKLYERLNHKTFIYTHQGYIVNFDHIKEVAENVVYLGDGKEVPISRSHYKEVRERHMNKIYLLRKEQRLNKSDI